MTWVYKYIHNGINNSGTSGGVKHWAVGFYVGDNFEIITYFETENAAIDRVSKLNGGQ